ncbi:MAG: SPW repeat protein [Ktedonobacteraceae bacterium]
MKTWRRWQDWATLVLGMLLLITPFVFGIATFGSSSWSASILGAVVGVVAVILALLWLGFPSNRVTEGMTVIVGTVLFISPWMLGEGWLTAGAWTSSIVGVLLVIAAGAMSVENWSRQAGFPNYRASRKGLIESETPQGYRRLSNPT